MKQPPERFTFSIDIHPPRWWRRQWKAVAELESLTCGAMEVVGFQGVRLVRLADTYAAAHRSIHSACDEYARRRDEQRRDAAHYARLGDRYTVEVTRL